MSTTTGTKRVVNGAGRSIRNGYGRRTSNKAGRGINNGYGPRYNNGQGRRSTPRYY